MSSEDRQDPLAKVETERRDFLKKIAIAAAFAAPTIATFSVDGMRKKAFAQAAYDQPTVVDPLIAGFGKVTVNFSQPMNTGVGADASRGVLPPCRTTTISGISFAVTSCTWNGETQQIITYTGDCEGGSSGSPGSALLSVTYNQGGCGNKFVGKNGLELKPYSGSVTVSGLC